MRILALDLGLSCGWAMQHECLAITHGAIQLTSTRKRNRYGDALAAFRAFLGSHTAHVFAYEDVKRHLGTRAAHVYGALEGLVVLRAHDIGATVMPLGVTAIKKHATGRGNASKDEMLAAAKAKWPHCKTHDEADALWILSLAMEKLR